MTRQTLTIPVPRVHWLTANGRMHWATRATRTRALRLTGRVLAAAKLTPAKTPVDITAIVCYPTARKADPANAAPTVKALIDGLVDARILPDDDHRHLRTVAYRRGPDTKQAGVYQIVLEIQEVTE